MTDDDDPLEATLISRRPAMVVPQAPPPVAVAHFLVFTRDGEVQRVRIGPGGALVGRTPPCDIVLPEPEISRRHCRIDIRDGHALLIDLGATNGTFLGGVRVEEAVALANGSQISLGTFPIRYEQRDPAQLAEEAALASEIRRAADYVRAILPPPLEHGPVRADWWFAPSSHLGGDAFGYQFLDEGCFSGFLIDVSGHGIGSAMHAANVANVLRRRVLPGVDFRDPAQVAAGLNAAFPMEDHNHLMLTLWYFVHDLGTRELRYCAAGHHPAFLAAADGTGPVLLGQRGPAIGMLPAGRWTAGSTRVPAGSRLYLFSDGAFEIIGRDGREWGIEDLRRLVAAEAGQGAPEAGDSEAGALYRAVRAGARPGPLDDDFSMVVLRFM